MKAMILAAGLGERMRPLTNHTPKPLLKVCDKPLIVYHIEKLVAAGFEEIIINIAHLGYKLPEVLGDGSKWGTVIHYSDEQEEGALESAGGIIKALPLLGDAPFLVVNGDVWSDYKFNINFDLDDALAHIIMVKNPEHHRKGDFGLEAGCVTQEGEEKYTFSGIGYYSPRLFKALKYGRLALGPLLREAMECGNVRGTLYEGEWRDIGTPERLKLLNTSLNKSR